MQFSPHPLLFFIFLNIPFLPSSSEPNPTSSKYKNCAPQPYKCGNTTFTISYPFHIDSRRSYCGNPDYFINCTNMNTTLTITIFYQQYKITNIDYDNNLINIVNEDFISDTGCPRSFTNTTINNKLFQYSPHNRKLTVYINCSAPLPIPAVVNYTCLDFGGRSYYSLGNGSLDYSSGKCSSIINVPLGQETANNLINGRLQFRQALQRGFPLQWTAGSDWCGNCVDSGGYCGFNSTDNHQHLCFCSNGITVGSCVHRTAGNTTRSIIFIILGVAFGLALLSLLGIPWLCGICRIIKTFYRKIKKKAKNADTIEAFLANFGSLATKRYAYSDVKRMTKSFSDKIGQGGYGSVYKGKLFNGHPVAIKILNETKGNGEDFINEVAAIGRTSHVNVVSLLGFCVEGSKRALIYDFMSNGSLDKYISLDKDTNERTLGWEKLYDITIGIARGLEYLHRGCNTRIVHFDIKPHNILLDQDFCPKISDFGMAKLCLPKQSIVSMCGARGTIGYIAPEVFSRAFGVVSSKSDVYSYGMMLLELFGSKRKNIAELESASENYFPQSIYQHIESKDNLDANEYGLTEEYAEIAKKIMIVGFWCIQTMPENRPTISRVVEMLEASLHDLSIPPKPILSSPLDLIMSMHTASSS